MAFEKGNQLGAKSRAFDGALRRAIAQDDGKRLREAAEKLLTYASEGQAWAIKELADRLDGKSQQNVSLERKDVRDLSLSELVAELAQEVGSGSEGEAGGADQSSALH
jgi:hypothetical protein